MSLELLSKSRFLESRAQCWRAAETAAALVGSGPPLVEVADTRKVSALIANGCDTTGPRMLPPVMKAALLAANPKVSKVLMRVVAQLGGVGSKYPSCSLIGIWDAGITKDGQCTVPKFGGIGHALNHECAYRLA